MVALGSAFSAVWIDIAKSWMHTPAGYQIVGEGVEARAEITDFWEMVLNPSAMERLAHVLGGAWAAGAFLLISVSAYYLLKNKHVDFAKASLKIGLSLALFASFWQLVTGHMSAEHVAEHQPAKLAAFEGHYQTGAGDPYLLGWVDDESESVIGIALPGMLSFLLYGDIGATVTGLDQFAESDRPNVRWIFQFYHLMVAIGIMLIVITVSAVGMPGAADCSSISGC